MQILVAKISFLFSYTHYLSLNLVTEALPILVVISSLRERLLVMVAPKYVKEFMTSRGVPLIMTYGGLATSWPMALVFLMLIIRPNSLHACENLLNSSWSSSAVWLTNAASSANSSSQIRIVLTLVFALNLAKLNSLQSDLACRKTSSRESWKAYCRSVEKKIPNSVGARTHPCFTPLVILQAGMRYNWSWLCCGCFHGRMICWEVLVDILFSSGFWTICPYWQN